MPFAEDLVKVAVRGSFLSSNGGIPSEEFVFGITLQRHSPIPDTFDWQENTQAVADGVADRIETHFVNLLSRWAPTVRFDEVRAYHLNTTGNTLHMGQAPITGIVGTGDVSLPTEVAMCVSLYAYAEGVFNPAGGKARGRFFLPAPSRAQIDVGGVLSSAARLAFATNVDAFLEDVQGMNAPGVPADDAHFDVVIASGVDAGARQVQRSRYGLVLDAQRRRRRSLDEAYIDRDLSNH